MFSVAAASAANGANPHFRTETQATLDTASGAVSISFTEVGLGSNIGISYCAGKSAAGQSGITSPSPILTFEPNMSVTAPNGLNKYPVSGTVTSKALCSYRKNGSISQSLKLTPDLRLPSIRCGGNSQLKLLNVSYSNLNLADVSKPVTVNVVPSKFKRNVFT